MNPKFQKVSGRLRSGLGFIVITTVSVFTVERHAGGFPGTGAVLIECTALRSRPQLDAGPHQH